MEDKTDSSRVSLSRWIGFWVKKGLRYEPAPPRRENKTTRLKSSHNSTGAIPEISQCSRDEEWTHYALENGLSNSPMIAFSGEGVARYFDKKEARKRIHQGDNIAWVSMMLNNSELYDYIENNDAPELELNYFMSIRFGYLPLRNENSIIIEPYSPHQFSRQFGFYQGIPAGSISTKTSEVAPQGCSHATPKTGNSSASMVMLSEQCKGKGPQLLIEAPTEQAYDQDKQDGDADLAVLEIPDNVDSLSRTLIVPFKEESGESVFGPNPIKSSSVGKTETETTSISRNGVRATLSSDLQKHPTATVSVFDGKKVVLNYRKMFISELWSVIRGKISGSNVDCASSLKEEVQVILEEMARIWTARIWTFPH
ncbi:hypothetical protein HAX54_011126 [Datura stramonium]|uniref:Uncharacterized protein n=1 Tax=Datura stramonium TaxID=4076 RepID=A0ABS8RXL2_DATST|nr:hypothetical protein [Datura stramonium]